MVLLLVVLAAWVGFLAIRNHRRWKRAEEKYAALASDASKLREELSKANGRIADLAKYEPLIEIDRYVEEQRGVGQQLVADADRYALAKRQQSESAAEVTLAEARSKGSAKLQEAERKLQAAYERTKEIVDAANTQAQAIAGDAYDALQNAKRYEEAAEAMKNVIEGYGDRYLLPAFHVLDELANEYAFDEAGARLKRARETVRDMIKRGLAANCEYVETNRRETAINFVLDAFNGKCDTVLADVRHDNFGTLERKIKDGYTLINLHGQAFRNAKVEQPYLEARLEELRWAVAVHELKVKEREEQRAIKERIREEEKAQRDFEKAMKEAAKEESAIRKAMEKAQAEIANATAAQRAKYEAKLAELNERLRVAEEKNQRALSMAQQTKSGHVYVISNEGSFGEHVYKIGLTRRLDPNERIRELGDASVPFSFDVHALIRSDDAPALERELQKRFLRNQVNKVNPRKEFFRVPLAEIKNVAESIGCSASWTMKAASQDYRETLAIEKRMKEHTFDEAAWATQQLREADATRAQAENDVVEIAS